MHLETIVNYRTEVIKNDLTAGETFKIKITNSNSETKWLNITAEELAKIATLLNTEEQ